MTDSEEPMEVTLNTEAETGASELRITGGGAEGITVSQVLKESSGSNVFHTKEGDRLLSATIYFDNITYEDALKILQHSEPYRVQFHLKRKIGKEERERMNSDIQFKKEKQTQEKGKRDTHLDATSISEKLESDQTVRKREHKKKRSKKDRLSWPKFQSITNTKFLGHRRSRSTSETNEEEAPDTPAKVSGAHFEEEDVFTRQRKENEYQKEFPKMELHSKKTSGGEQTCEKKSPKVSEPNRRAKEKRSLDSSVNVRVDHHTMPKSQIKKGISLHSSISSGTDPGKTSEWIREVKRDDASGLSLSKEKFPEVEVIIVKEKNLPSPCKVSPIPKRDQTISLQKLEASTAQVSMHIHQASTTQTSSTVEQGEVQIPSSPSSPTKDEMVGSKLRKKKLKKAKFEATHLQEKQLHDIIRTEDMDISEDYECRVDIPHRKTIITSENGVDTSLTLDTQTFAGIYKTEIKVPEAETEQPLPYLALSTSRKNE